MPIVIVGEIRATIGLGQSCVESIVQCDQSVQTRDTQTSELCPNILSHIETKREENRIGAMVQNGTWYISVAKRRESWSTT